MTEKEKFKRMLKKYPSLRGFWKEIEGNFDTKGASVAVGLSPSELVILKCLSSIWGGASNGNDVDFTDIAALSIEDRKPLVEFLVNPFWP